MSNSAVILKAKNIIQLKNEEWLRLYTFSAGGMGLISGREQKSHMLCGTVKKVLKNESWNIRQEKKKKGLRTGPIVISLGP